MNIELLETRIAPAAIFTYTDFDGDKVTVKTSKGTNTDLAAILTFSDLADNPRQLRLVNFTLNPAVFSGTDVSITAVKKGNGNGNADVGYINATGVNLGKVTVDGDLGEIDAGVASSQNGIKSAKIGSMGIAGNAAGGGISAESKIKGGAKSFVIKGDIRAQSLAFEGGKTDLVMIGGSVIGSSNLNSGSIISTEFSQLKKVIVGKNLIGGSGQGSGSIFSNNEGAVGTVEIKGSIYGDSGQFSGSISAGSLEKSLVRVKGNVYGSDGTDSGSIFASRPIYVGQNVMGGFGTGSGSLHSDNVTIGENLKGGIGQGSGSIIYFSDIKKITIGGDVIGRNGNSGIILARGSTVITQGKLAIESVVIKGSMISSAIKAGYDSDGSPGNGDASIGKVTIGRDFIASDIVSGVVDLGVPGFGSGDTLIASGNNPTIIAKISSVIIKGRVAGEPNNNPITKFHAITSQQIDLVKIGSYQFKGNPASSETVPILTVNGDFRIAEAF
jgi:hypothetical protein